MMTVFKENKLASRCLIGFVQGFYLYLLFEMLKQHVFSGITGSYFLVPQVLVMVFVPLLLIQGLGNMRSQTLIKWGFISTILIIVTSYYAVYREIIPTQTYTPDNILFPGFDYDVSLLISLFIAQSLILSSDADQKFRANYNTYFDLSWKLALQAICTWAFTGIFWGLLFLGAGLFKIIHLDFFYDMITKSWFSCPATGLAVAVGIHATDVNVRMIQGVRTMVLVLLSWLLPMITAIIALFLVCLVFMGLEPLWKTRYAAALLIATVMIFVLLINAAFQDGTRLATAGRFQQITTRLACCLLLPLMLLAAYALSLRVAQYGWSVSRIYAACIMLILFAYAVGYFLAAIVSKADLLLIEGWNFATSLLILAVAFAVFTPLADPARLMVNNQISRLQSGLVAPEKFDFNAVRFKGLRYGYNALTDLQTSWQGANAEYVKTTIKDVLAKKASYYDYDRAKTNSDFIKDITLHTPNAVIPESFIKQQWDRTYDYLIPTCLTYKGYKCDAWMIKDNQNKPIIILKDYYVFVAFQTNSAGKWEISGTWDIPSGCESKISKSVTKNDVQFTAPEPQGQDILVAGMRLPFMRQESCK